MESNTNTKQSNLNDNIIDFLESYGNLPKIEASLKAYYIDAYHEGLVKSYENAIASFKSALASLNLDIDNNTYNSILSKFRKSIQPPSIKQLHKSMKNPF